MLPEYTWVDLEVDTYFSRYNHLSDLSNLISWLPICTITNPDACLVTFHTVRSNATSLTEFVFMNREGINRDFFYMYDCLFRGLHVRVPFDNFAMGVLLIFNVAPMQLHPNGWVAMQAFHYDKYPKELLSPNECQDLKFLETLRRQLPARPLGSLLQSPNLVWNLES
ncbi:hypothetical protein JHK87_012803 [Glycine soja]|nr:hypothetical protein JHK87_012803 [Glycine soja]